MLLIACSQDDAPTPTVEPTAPPADTSTPVIEATATPPPTATATLRPTDTPQPTDTPEPELLSSGSRERPYRSYPAPTGEPGFRKYYQKRCYPGCHTYDSEQVHP